MIRNKNNGRAIANSESNRGFDWDVNQRKIILTSNRQSYVYQRNFNFNTIEKIFNSKQTNRAYEIYIQLYFVENIGINTEIGPIVGNNIIWFGNEVACGVGMQKIDLLTICKRGERNEFRMIEFKDEPIAAEIIDQIEYYVNWGSQDQGRHLDGAYSWNIRPVIVAPPHKTANWQSIINAFKNYNDKHISLPLDYFEFHLFSANQIRFEKVNYMIDE